MMNKSAEERYQNDPVFHRLVHTMLQFIVEGQFTPSELREASILAATKYEMTIAQPSHLYKSGQ